MFDTHSIARALSEADLTPAQVDAIPRGGPSGAELRTEIAGLRADLTWRMLAVAGLVIAALRLL